MLNIKLLILSCCQSILSIEHDNEFNIDLTQQEYKWWWWKGVRMWVDEFDDWHIAAATFCLIEMEWIEASHKLKCLWMIIRLAFQHLQQFSRHTTQKDKNSWCQNWSYEVPTISIDQIYWNLDRKVCSWELRTRWEVMEIWRIFEIWQWFNQFLNLSKLSTSLKWLWNGWGDRKLKLFKIDSLRSEMRYEKSAQ